MINLIQIIKLKTATYRIKEHLLQSFTELISKIPTLLNYSCYSNFIMLEPFVNKIYDSLLQNN